MPSTDVTIEPAGTIVKLTGRVEGFNDDRTAIVAFGCPGGGTIGVSSKLTGAKVGDLVAVDATVVVATRDDLKVTVPTATATADVVVSRWKALQ